MRALTATLAAALLAAAPAHAQDEPEPRAITVAGAATIRVVNDTAGFTTGVEVRRATARAALREASRRMSSVLAAIRRGGVADADVRTSRVGVHRVKRRGVVSYAAVNTVSVTVRAIATTGAVIDAAVRSGANVVSGPRFWRADTRDLYRRALVAALRNARAKAEALAADSGATLGPVQRIAESGVDVVYEEASSDAQGAVGAPVRSGRTRVTAELTAVFAIA